MDSNLVAEVKRAVALALSEDRADDDVTTLAVVDASAVGSATLLAKEPGVLCGIPVALDTLRQLDPAVALEDHCAEGMPFETGQLLGRFHGPVRALLSGERVALNFVQRLSGVATATARYVATIEGTGVAILDTRKTTPGLRALEKYAVRCGGGTNHRLDLASMAMIKDNHREALARAGKSLAQGAAAIRARAPHVPVEIEADSLDEIEAALAARPDWILLDNMPVDDMREAVKRIAGRAKVEASGGVTLATVRAIAETGVDAISVGAITHSAPALDISLELEF